MLELIKISKDCKVKLSVTVIFRSTKNNNDKRTLCIKSEDTTDINEIFDQLIKKHNDLIKPLKNIDTISEGIESITYNFTEIIKINTFLESPRWLKLERCIMNPQNNDNKCFQCSIIHALYHQQIKNNLFRISKFKPFVNNLNWNNISFPSQQQYYKTFEISNKSIALNILCIPYNTEK